MSNLSRQGHLIDAMDLNELGVQARFKDEVARYNKFRRVLGVSRKEKVELEIDIRAYAKYLLQEGTIAEKREFLGCMRSRITIFEKTLKIITK